jgi:ribosomal protein S18 acetylase RimI-like enzyme
MADVATALSIRPATTDDREWSAQLMASSEPWITLGRKLDTCRIICHNPEYVVFVAHEGESRYGFVLLHRRGVVGSPYLATIAVHPDWRSRGIGSRLIRFAEDYFRSHARHIFLCVSSFNHRARILYERLGYRQVGELPDYLIDGASEYLMHKRLDRP